MKKMLFIYNPKAGKAQIRTQDGGRCYLQETIIRFYDDKRINAKFIPGTLCRRKLAEDMSWMCFDQVAYRVIMRLPFICTQKSEDAMEKTKGSEQGPRSAAKEYDIVVCSGGDGTLDEVVTGMIRSGFRTPIGYIPAGSTNDFGGSLGLPKNMVHAAETIVKGNDFACDVGSFNQDIFVYIAAFGLFTDVSYETGQDMKNVLGHMAYLLEGMKRLPAIRSYPMRVTYDDTTIVDDFIFGMITNSVSVGGFKRITGKNVKLDDGVFEVTLIKRPKNPDRIKQYYGILTESGY